MLICVAPPLTAQVSLYGKYQTGESRDKVDKLGKSLRLNGMYYYIQPDFDSDNKLVQIRMINYDYVTTNDHNIVRNYAKGLVDLMTLKFHAPARLNLDSPLICEPDTPNPVAVWNNDERVIAIDIACTHASRFHLILTIKANPHAITDEPPVPELAEN